jgi:hypothetical protein
VNNTKGGSWLITENEIYQNGVGIKSGCPASRLSVARNWIHSNGVGVYNHFNYITHASFWMEVRDNLIEENYIGLFSWNTPDGNLLVRGSNKFLNNYAMGVSFMRAAFLYQNGAVNDYVTTDWVCDPDECASEFTLRAGIEGREFLMAPGTEVATNDVMIAGQVVFLEGLCPFRLTDAAWVTYQDLPGPYETCDVTVPAFVDEAGQSAIGRPGLELLGSSTVSSTCRTWQPTFCPYDTAYDACHQEHPEYPKCCDPEDDLCTEYPACPGQ